MANTTDVDDVRAEALDRVGEDGSDESGDFYSEALVYIVEVFHLMWFHKPWRFTRADPPGPFASVAPITGLTVSVTNASTSATLSASQTPDLVKRKIKIGNNVYRIVTHGGASAAIVLDLAYQDDTDTAAVCTIFQDEYDLGASDFGRLINIIDVSSGRVVGRKDLKHPRILAQKANPSEGVPSMFALMTDTRIVFDSYPQDARRYEYNYQTQPTDPSGGGNIDLPRRWRFGLRDGVASKLAGDKDDDRQGSLWSEHLATLERMEREEVWDTESETESELVIV